jgi:hypothetical protein
MAVGIGLLTAAAPALATSTPCSSPTFIGTTATVTCPVGVDDTWTVPAGVSQATFDLQGAAGGTAGAAGGAGGAGGDTTATIIVSGGTVYHVAVGSKGGDGNSTTGAAGGAPGGGSGPPECFPDGSCALGGGGGGASVLAISTVTSDTSSWLLAAGGGGGGTNTGSGGGAGGGGAGGNGGDTFSCVPGGTTMPGGGGGQDVSSGSGQHLNGSDGGAGGGGGGGGFVGGAGGDTGCGGGGGSGFTSTGGTTTQGGGSNGDGTVTITYNANATTTSVSAPASSGTGAGIGNAEISATLSGAASGAGGTITFKVFGPQSSPPIDCVGGTTVGNAAVSGSGTYHPSAGFTPTSAGKYWWYASYSGDTDNGASNSECDGMATMTSTSVVNAPSITTSQQPASATVGGSIADKATVSGGDSPTGTVTFNLYNNSNGTGTPLFTDANEPLAGGAATSKGYTTTATGTDHWVATYNGDSNNNSVTSGTADEPVTVVYGFGGFMAPLPKSTSTYQSGSTIPVKFVLTNASGQPIAASTASALAASHQVEATLSGPNTTATILASSLCTWSASGQLFQCNLKTPSKLRTGSNNAYSITALENVGGGFLPAPPYTSRAADANPETIFFK